MSDQFIGEIRAFGFNYAPYGWALCDGQTLPIAQYSALFAILGTIFGGNGQTTFNLPDLQNRAPMHWGAGPGLTPRDLGEVLGEPGVSLISSQMPIHTHALQGAHFGVATQQTATPSSSVWIGDSNAGQAYSDLATGSLDVNLAPTAISVAGGSQPHQNMQPVLALNYCIALQGIFPARS
jgi:microcystin-dependent protein